MAINPTPSCKNPAPFRCEVLLRPCCSSPSVSSGGCRETTLPPPSSSLPSQDKKQHDATPRKAGVAYFMRGWASRSPPTKEGGGSLLRQHVAARSATVVVGNSGGGGGTCSAGGSPSNKRAARVPSPTPPAAVFSALGVVSASGGKGLEKLATQEVTYVGKQLRIGRTKGGDVYVYERCAWPGDMDGGLMI